MPQNKDTQGKYDPLTDSPLTGEPLPAAGKNPDPVQTDTHSSQPFDLKSPLMRIATALVTLVLIIVVVLILKNFFVPRARPIDQAAVATQAQPTLPVDLQVNLQAEAQADLTGGIPRFAQLHTNIPDRPREEIEKYTVVEGDTVFGIAEKFGLKPETILWGNYYTLLDNPAFLSPGQILNILPVDGIYHRWNAGDGLNGVARFFGVTPEDIINYPLNNLTVEGVGDFANPRIEAGTMLMVPGGTRSFVTWSAPRITRDDPGVAKVLGPGFCGTVVDGPVGVEAFIWPTNNHFLSGYDYSPETNHYGIDLDGETGDPIYAIDNGVIVYSGWNDWGYGYMVVIDHGNGWQSLYAHLSTISVDCGGWVYQGTVIGYMGSTGRSSGSHLHFEMMSDSSGKVNPFAYMPPP